MAENMLMCMPQSLILTLKHKKGEMNKELPQPIVGLYFTADWRKIAYQGTEWLSYDAFSINWVEG